MSSFKHNDEIIVTLNCLKTEIWLSVKFIVLSFTTLQIWFLRTYSNYTKKTGSKKPFSTLDLCQVLAYDQSTIVYVMGKKKRKKKERGGGGEEGKINIYYDFFHHAILKKNIATGLSTLQLSHCLVIF